MEDSIVLNSSLPIAVLLERSTKMRSDILGNITLAETENISLIRIQFQMALVLLEKTRAENILKQTCLALVRILRLYTFN